MLDDPQSGIVASGTRPTARRDLLVSSVDDGTADKEALLYDPKERRAYYLNRTAAFVWEECDGNTSVTDLRLRVQQRLGSPFTEEVLWLTLRELEQQGLVGGLHEQAPRFTRQQIIKAGLAGSAILLPVIITLRAPKAALAQPAVSYLAQPRIRTGGRRKLKG